MIDVAYVQLQNQPYVLYIVSENVTFTYMNTHTHMLSICIDLTVCSDLFTKSNMSRGGGNFHLKGVCFVFCSGYN